MLDELHLIPSDAVDERAAHTVACVEIEVTRGGKTLPPMLHAEVMGLARKLIEHAVRADDHICPVASSRMTIEFGTVASGALPQVLGDRLARAVNQSPIVDLPGVQLSVSVGIACPDVHLPRTAVGSSALTSTRCSHSQLHRRPDTPAGGRRVIVTVDRPLTRRAASVPGNSPFQTIRRRSVYRYEAGRMRDKAAEQSHSSRTRPSRPGSCASDHAGLVVLVVDPMMPVAGEPSLAATGAAQVAERAGCRTDVLIFSQDDQLTCSIDGSPVDQVVLALDGAWAGQSPTWASGPWDIAARLTASYCAADIPVLAVSAGAGAGIVASCAAQGARPVFGLHQLADALGSQGSHPHADSSATCDSTLPPRFLSLVGLTISERRVLFYLTEGCTAQRIAQELVVSVTTVRSHIGSVLRKLGVRSQLAAVAIANSRDLGHAVFGEVS